MNTCNKIVFYHFKDTKDATHAYRTSDSVRQIKSDMHGNTAVLDAIYYVEGESVTLYSNNLTKSDVYANVYGL